jgi:hypothetical protein
MRVGILIRFLCPIFKEVHISIMIIIVYSLILLKLRVL